MRLLLELLFNLFCESRGLRGRRGAQQSSGGEAFSHTSVKTGLVAHSLAARSAIQLPRLPPPPRPLLPWTPTSCQKHVACCCACPCARARSAGHCGIWRMAESSSRGHHVICARTLGPRERQDAGWKSRGTALPSGDGQRACVASRESSVDLGLVHRGASIFTKIL